jgi:hypothetical protein
MMRLACQSITSGISSVEPAGAAEPGTPSPVLDGWFRFALKDRKTWLRLSERKKY